MSQISRGRDNETDISHSPWLSHEACISEAKLDAISPVNSSSKRGNGSPCLCDQKTKGGGGVFLAHLFIKSSTYPDVSAKAVRKIAPLNGTHIAATRPFFVLLAVSGSDRHSLCQQRRQMLPLQQNLECCEGLRQGREFSQLAEIVFAISVSKISSAKLTRPLKRRQRSPVKLVR